MAGGRDGGRSNDLPRSYAKQKLVRELVVLHHGPCQPVWGGGNRLEPEQGRGDQWGPVEVLMMIENRGVRRQASVSRV